MMQVLGRFENEWPTSFKIPIPKYARCFFDPRMWWEHLTVSELVPTHTTNYQGAPFTLLNWHDPTGYQEFKKLTNENDRMAFQWKYNGGDDAKLHVMQD